MFFVIVKGAADGFWEKKFKKDPKKNPVPYQQSAFHSHYGKLANCKIWYSEDNYEKAVSDCAKLNKMEPNNGYAICRLRE